MKKGSVSLSHLGTFPSPGASDYRDNGAMVSQKGWSSERVPRSSANSNGGSRRHISASSLTPFYSGRTLPSKWEDAERWICSPVLGYGVSKNLNYQYQRRPKSKSGPIVPPGIAFYSNCSPSMNLQDGGGSGSVKNLMAGSPFSTGVLMADGVSVHYVGYRATVSAAAGGDSDGEQPCTVQSDSNEARSAIIPGWSDLVCESSLPSSQDEKLEEIKDAKMMINHVVLRRDMATQMSPDESSNHSSSRERSSFGHSPPPILPLPAADSNDHPSKLDIREVQIDKRATVINWSKRHGSRRIKKGEPDFDDFYRNSAPASVLSLDISEASTSISNLQREEAKIIAWENLQRAKAEAAIRKLEMKLEKKRSASLDKILRKLRTSQIKAQEMRNSISDKEDEQIPRTSAKFTFFHIPMSYFSTCFTCHGF
ncbi:hypothetical protein F3Y22_tig00110437pilonHSYRG00006 [Hibiscus syriacus]|uniref:Remorin C-terminal domain-containing protein n=1 Tax=Hibiscus syriacus TaxID=106335 RepID=A0A6A3AN09_HIBSY|nr:uncharacterized protein LOC120125707 isoform X1 [Hibiscus syriacus]KAE8704797.1 hypothetical protein F3Y22_tig00110437pilonHSYRG00006 [Hibiscus syriacus]